MSQRDSHTIRVLSVDMTHRDASRQNSRAAHFSVNGTEVAGFKTCLNKYTAMLSALAPVVELKHGASLNWGITKSVFM